MYCKGLLSKRGGITQEAASRTTVRSSMYSKDSNTSTVANLKLLRQELLALSRITFPSSDQITKFDETVAAYSRAFQDLGGDIPTDVRDALQAAASPSGAPIDKFTSNVRAWLQERGLAGSFRVFSKSTS